MMQLGQYELRLLRQMIEGLDDMDLQVEGKVYVPEVGEATVQFDADSERNVIVDVRV